MKNLGNNAIFSKFFRGGYMKKGSDPNGSLPFGVNYGSFVLCHNGYSITFQSGV